MRAGNAPVREIRGARAMREAAARTAPTRLPAMRSMLNLA